MENKDLKEQIILLNQEVKDLKDRIKHLEKVVGITAPIKEELPKKIVELPKEVEKTKPQEVLKEQPQEVAEIKEEKPENFSWQEEKPKEAKEPNALFAWLGQVNILLKTGVLILFLGLAFLLRYVGGAMPLSLRYVAVFVAGIIAAVGGEFLQKKRREYGLTLQGLGFGIMYLTALAAVKLHHISAENIALIFMVAAVFLMAWRAVIKDAKLMAQVAVLGGLAAPILVSNGTGSHIVLFSYLAILNLGVAYIAWFKTWRSLNIIAATGTLAIAVLWSPAYKPSYFISCEFFLLYHLFLYTIIACFFAHNTLKLNPLAAELRDIPNNASLDLIIKRILAFSNHLSILDSSLLFGTALSSFALQYHMTQIWGDNPVFYSALLWASIYAAFAFFYHKRFTADFNLLKSAFALLALIFITLAIPLKFSESEMVSFWALEAALVYIFAIFQKLPQSRLVALIIFVLASASQFANLSFSY